MSPMGWVSMRIVLNRALSDLHKAGPAPSYDPDKLIKPDEHDPEQFLCFHSTGEVRARDRISEQAREIAQVTIDVFGLNEGSLQGKRRKAIKAIKQRYLQDLEEIETWSDQDRQSYLQVELEATRWDPYATTVRHFLMAAYDAIES
jgi:hypothetical protein